MYTQCTSVVHTITTTLLLVKLVRVCTYTRTVHMCGTSKWVYTRAHVFM